VAVTPQESVQFSASNIADLVSILKLSNENASKLIKTVSDCFIGGSADQTSLSIAYSTVVASSGCILVSTDVRYLVSVSVTTASTGPQGLLYDSATISNAGSSNAFAIIPSSGLMLYNWPINQGLVVKPSSQGAHTVSVSYI
jgi:hypothetical protein